MYLYLRVYFNICPHVHFSVREVVRVLLLANFGKILVVPAILWGHSYSHIYLWLSTLFVAGANIQAMTGNVCVGGWGGGGCMCVC
jgi:hypothetical protein